MKIKFDDNFPEIIADIEGYSKEVDKQCQEILKKRVFKIEADAKKKITQNKSVDTGHMRRSVMGQMNNKYEGEVGVNVKYATHVENGTKYQRAKPFLRPTVEKNEKEFMQEIEKVLSDEW